MTDKPWSERIPTAIADGEKLLDDAEYVLMPPHMWGNKTKLTLVLTAGEVALADGLRQAAENLNAEFGGERWPPELVEFTEKMEKVKHD